MGVTELKEDFVIVTEEWGITKPVAVVRGHMHKHVVGNAAPLMADMERSLEFFKNTFKHYYPNSREGLVLRPTSAAASGAHFEPSTHAISKTQGTCMAFLRCHARSATRMGSSETRSSSSCR